MKIKRKELLEDLYEFALGGNGMVVGIPGIGKSYLLGKLKDKLISNDVLCFIIKIDNAYDSSDDAIAVELGTEGKWIDILGNIQLRNENKAVLIFDAFDAARDEEKRLGFLKQIKRAKSLLKDKWNVLVSVRTYDATKSEDLMKLFSPSIDLGGFAAARKIKIGELTEIEIEEAAKSIPNLYSFYLASTSEFKEILHVPFFLKILGMMLLDYVPDNLEEIKHYKSEAQLLDFFWQKKIDETKSALAKQKFLYRFTQQLIKNKVLSFPKNELMIKAENNEFDTFDHLRSENIIDEVSWRNSRIAYSHNIFFDYAVNRLCLDHDYNSLVSFLEEDYSRAFFLRPSLVYFFTSVWYEDQKIFWDLYQKLVDNEEKEIQLFVRLIINGTIASQFAHIGELNKILELHGTVKGNESIRNVLQSLRFIRNKTTSQDISLLHFLSKSLHLQYLFEFSILLERAISDTDSDSLKLCGESARNLLSFILDNRNSDSKQYLDRIGSSRGVELVAITFGTDPEESADVVRRIFSLIEQPGFEIGYFTNLSEHIKYFVELDPVLVSEVYEVIFGHQEMSTEKTQMVTSVVMNLISNRRQDFDLCHYRLGEFFPTFISSSPELATLTGLKIVNEICISNTVHSNEGRSFTFKYEDIICSFYPDNSTIWSNSQINDKSENIGEHITSYIGNLLEENEDEQVSNLIRIYITNAKVGFLWKLLMELANEYPVQTLDLILPLAFVPQFLSSEVSHEVRSFLEKVNSLLSDEQIQEIEEVVFQAYSDEQVYGIQAALSSLNLGRLQTTRAKKFMSGREALKDARSDQSMATVTPYTTEDWLKDQGVDITDVHISELTKSINYLDNFTHQFLNGIPSYKEYKPYLKIAVDLYKEIILNEGLQEDLKFRMLNAASKTAAISSRNLEELPEEDFNFIKQIVIYSFQYISKYDAVQENKSAVSGFSPTPKIEAAEALVLLYIHEKDPATLSLYKVAISDASSVVRYNAIKNLPRLFNDHYDIYKEILFECLKTEKDAFNFSALLSALYFKKGKISTEGNAIIQISNQNPHFFQQQNQFVNSYAELLLWFLTQPDMPEAFDTLVDGYKYRYFSNAVIFRVFKQIHTYPRQEFLTNLSAIRVKLTVIDSYIDQAGQVLQKNSDFSKLDPEVENALKIFDEVVMRLYFALETKQRVSNNQSLQVDDENRRDLYFLVKPLIEKILNFSSQITDRGMILGHTAHYLIQTLNSVISYDSKNVLSMVAEITRYSMQVGYTFDIYSIREIVSLTETLLADHRGLLMEEKSFQDLLSILEIHINSGWVDAHKLLWRLDQVFK